MGGRARARSHRLARAAAFIAVAALGFTTILASTALATAQPASGTHTPQPKPTPHVLTDAPALAARPPGTTSTSPAAAAKPTSPPGTKSTGQQVKKPAEDPQGALHAAQAAASAKAKNTDAAVDVPELTTERSITEANPDGSFTSTTTFVPQRAMVGGAWAPIDTTLAQNADGSWAPKATVAGISLSDGGTGPLASVRIGDKTITMSWPLGALPAPQVTGNHATYSQVLPGVDLRVSADAEGIREVLVVADHNAASNPDLASLALSLGTTGVNLSQSDDGLTATDATTGRTVFTSAAPIMWDSTGDSAVSNVRSAATTPDQDPADSPSLSAHVAEMPVHLQGNTVTITPSQSMIDDSTTAYPIYIDPPVTIGTYHYAEIYSNAGQTGTAYFDSGVSGSPNGPVVRAGYDAANGGGYVRGMFSFDVGDAMAGQENSGTNPNGAGLPEDGSDITGAQLVLTSNSNPCNNGANISVDVDGVNRMDAGAPPTWSQDGPSGSGHTDAGTYYAPVWATTNKLYSANPSACGGAGNTIKIQDNTGGPLTSMVSTIWRNWSQHNGDAWCPCTGDGTATFGIKWTNEAASGTYGSWEVGNASIPAKLVITYIPAPVINQSPTVTPGNSGTPINSNCGPDDSMPTSGPGTYISKNISNSVTLGASFYDIDGGRQIQTQYEFSDVSTGSSNDQFYPGPGGSNYYTAIGSAQGGQVSFPFQTITTATGGLQEGHTYKFYPRAVDTFDSRWLDSSIYGFSTSCRFTIAFQPPSPPALAANGAPDFPALGSGVAPAKQLVAAQPDSVGITVQDSTAGVQIDHFDYVFNGDSSRIPQNAPGCAAGNGCIPAGATNTPTGSNNLAGFSASVNIPVLAGVTRMGDNSLWVQAVDVAGNRSGVFQYQFYLPGNPNTTSVLGDVTGNGYPSIVVAAPDPAKPNVEHLVVFPGNTDPDIATNGVEAAPAAAAPDGTSWANTLITHRGAERGMPVDDLYAYSTTTHALYYYLNSAVFGGAVPTDTFTGGSPTAGAHRIVITRPPCVPSPANKNCSGYAKDWSNVTQILALGNAAGGTPGTFAGRTNLITVEPDGNHGADVWMFSPAGGEQLTNPILLSDDSDTSKFSWANVDLIAPGPTTSSGLPDLWARDRASGNLYQLLNKRNAAGVEDPSSLGNKASATPIGAPGAYESNSHTVLISAGNPTVTGSQSYTYPALWSVSEPGGQLKLMQGASGGPALDTSAQAASWPSSTTSWTNATGATNINGGTVTNATGPILLGVDKNAGTNLCMDLAGAVDSPGNYVQGFTCNGTPAQMWTIVSDGTIRWGSATSDACLTVSISPAPAQHGLPSAAGNNGTNAGSWANTPVVIEPCPAAGSTPLGTQLWMYRTSVNAPQGVYGHDWYTIYNPASGMDLDNYQCATTPGVQLELYTAQDGTCQWWQSPASQDSWLHASGPGLATQTKEPISTTATASTTTGQATPNGADYTLAATQVNDHYGVDWNIPYDGTYAIWAYMATGPTDGQVQVTVDQSRLPLVYDTYAATAGWKQLTFGDIALTAGMHSFTFTIAGKNAASAGYNIGLDTLFAGPDHGTGPHAALTTSGGTATIPLIAPAAITLDATQSWPGGATLATNAYTFDFGDGTATAASPSATASHTYTAAGVYTASVTVTDSAGASATTSRLVYVTAPPANLASTDGTTNAPCVATASAAPTMTSLTPTLSATVNTGLSAQFELRDITDPSITPPITIGGAGSAGSAGPTSTVATPTLVNGHEYGFAARSADTSGNISPTSSTCYFWALTSGSQAIPSGAIGLAFDNTIYSASNNQTWTGPLTHLTFQNDGALVLTRNSDNTPLWTSGTGGNPGAALAMQYDGNMVIYTSTPTVYANGTVHGTPLWNSGTGSGTTHAILQADGHFAIYAGTTRQWTAEAVGHWTLGDGIGTTAADTGYPGGHTATLTGGASLNPGKYGTFDGSTGYAATTAAAVDTTRPFTVSAWAKLANLNGYQTVVTQQGNQVGGFHLEFENNGSSGNNWAFVRATTDATTTSYIRATSPAGLPQAGVWTHLVGVWDPASSTISLYVNGQLVGSATDTSPIPSPGPLVVGRGYSAGAANNFVNGYIADVRAYQQPFNSSQASWLYQNSGFVGAGYVNPPSTTNPAYTFADTTDWNGDGKPDLIARDNATCNLYVYLGQGASSEIPSTRTLIGTQWCGMAFAGLADWQHTGLPGILARENATGILWFYPNTGARIQVGTQWNGYTFAGAVDWQHNGHYDIIAREDSTGILWEYPGDATGGGGGSRVQVSTGWNGYTFAGIADGNNDGHWDIVALEQTTGILWFNPGDATGGGGSRTQLGTGWGSMILAGVVDWDKDGSTDILARNPNGTLLAYNHNATPGATDNVVQIGTGW